MPAFSATPKPGIVRNASLQTLWRSRRRAVEGTTDRGTEATVLGPVRVEERAVERLRGPLDSGVAEVWQDDRLDQEESVRLALWDQADKECVGDGGQSVGPYSCAEQHLTGTKFLLLLMAKLSSG